MKGMRSEDIAKILTSENFKELKTLKYDQDEALEETCQLIFWLQLFLISKQKSETFILLDSEKIPDFTYVTFPTLQNS